MRKRFREVFDRQKGQCAICGFRGPLELAHIIPMFRGGKDDLSNLQLLCPSCHQQMDRGPIREFEFVHDLSSLIALHPDFRITSTHKRHEIDLLVHWKTESADRLLLLECKSGAAISTDRLHSAIQQMKRYSKEYPTAQPVFAAPIRLSETQKELFTSEKFLAWDLDAIAHIFKKEVDSLRQGFFRSQLKNIISMSSSETIESNLIEELKKCKPGRDERFTYQKLVCTILEILFCPPLASPIFEMSDESEVNRRDMIFPNYCNDGFWLYLRNTYKADFIVVDAKNYSGDVPKVEALKMLNYLKPHGTGLFGLIVTRFGADPGCKKTLKDEWKANNKMIIVVTDNDIIRMIRARESGANPASIIQQLIEDFRLSI